MSLFIERMMTNDVKPVSIKEELQFAEGTKKKHRQI
jgi:hypothetical protein